MTKIIVAIRKFAVLKESIIQKHSVFERKYEGQYLDQLKKATVFGELKQIRSWKNS